MSCHQKTNFIAQKAARVGINQGVSKQAFFLGVTAARLLGGWLWARQHFRHRRSSSPLSSATNRSQVRTLSGSKRVEPISSERLAGQCCAGCQTASQEKRGVWYELKGQIYCQDCAQQKAGQEGISLVLPALAKPTRLWTKYREGKRIDLKPSSVNIGSWEGLEGFLVEVEGKASGLTITPEYTLEAGQISTNHSRWFVNYQRAGKPLAGPYTSLNEAKEMASLLADFDWTKSAHEFTNEELRGITKIVNDYREGRHRT